MILFLLPYAIQILLIFHAIRNGKNTTWIWLLIMVPYVGGLIYVFMEILPDLRRGRLVDTESLVGLVDRNVRIKRLKENILVSDTVANRSELAAEYLRLGAFGEAETHYEALLTGVYREERSFLMQVARCAFLREDYPKAEDYFLRADAQGRISATDGQAWMFYTRFCNRGTAESLAELENLYEVTKNSEVAFYLARSYIRLGTPGKIERLLTIAGVQQKNARGLARRNIGQFIEKIRKLSTAKD